MYQICIKFASSCQVLHPFIFAEARHHPRNFPHFIEAGAGIDCKGRPVQHKRPGKRERNRDKPHTYNQAVHIKQRIPAAVQHPIDRDGIDTAPDHIDSHNHHHSSQISSRLVCQDHHPHDKRRHRKHKRRGQKANDI